jgi:SAM-dependent methyltransferase
MSENLYLSGEYSAMNPGYHVEDSPFKADQIMKMLALHSLSPSTVCELGCGAGEILRQLQQRLPAETRLDGYEISPHAFEACRKKENPTLHFHCEDLLCKTVEPYDLLLCIDVVEHVEDCFGFLRRMKPLATHKILHIPLDMTAQSVLRGSPILLARNQVGHLHYFMKDTALALLKEAGHEVVDWFYTPIGIDRAVKLRSRVARWPRQLLFQWAPDLAARMLGGFSLLALTR